jgi:hypothetical protein
VSQAGHHNSHRGLIDPSASRSDREAVDAIIVPSARRAAALAEAGRLAQELDCVLLVLCSKHSEASRVIRFLAHRPSLRLTAVDFPETGVARLPALETSTVLGESRLKRRTDTSAKRNLGLVLARMAGWKRVVFLDDDITVPDAVDLERAAALLDIRDGVGLHIGGFPDNSVVCHANRETGDKQQATFIGGGALAVPADRIDSFFPEIYNEDWFFLLDDRKLRPVAQVGVAEQKPYDPFATPDRARSEEFGDLLAEGLFARFDDGKKIEDADLAYWTAFLEARRAFIREIRARIESKSEGISPRDKQILESLSASSGRLQFIQPRHCVGYIEAWRRDRARWRRFMNGVRPMRQATIDDAVKRLGLNAFTRQALVPPRPVRVPAAPRRVSVATA